MASVNEITDRYYISRASSLDEAALAGLRRMRADHPNLGTVSITKIRVSEEDGDIVWQVTITP